MYTTYFGLKEKPFSIAPNPQYLFMSDRHREALAHLTYGLGDAGGFVLLTGEVGTGKTTVSRCLMERLPENTQAAFILNPTLSNHELLATICDELKIRYRKTGATLKTLTDKIQDKLLKNHKANINTLLIIDEAQHLQPEVLEQLRLLTNLETNTKKLLQVILIGQPELQTLLKRRDLRQLAQRITARYHLLPLNKREVAQYIKHRLSIAEGVRALFSVSAMNTIYDICGGIPRLINLVCERSLINAYNSNMAVVDKKIVVLSAKEALGEDLQLTPWWQTKVAKILFGFILLLSVSIGAYYAGSYGSASQKESALLTDSSVIAERKKDSSTDNSIATQEEPNVLTDKMSENPTAKSVDKNIKKNILSANDAKAEKAGTNITTPIKIKNKKAQPHVEELVEEKLAVEQDVKEENREEAPVTIKSKATEKPSDEIVEKTQKTEQVEPVEGVSDELLAQFKKALTDEEQESADPEFSYSENNSNNNEIEPIERMPIWVQDGVPSLQFEQHIYASDGQGWVKVNGRDRYEGDTISRQLILVEILPQKVVLSFRGEKFTMPALSSW